MLVSRSKNEDKKDYLKWLRPRTCLKFDIMFWPLKTKAIVDDAVAAKAIDSFVG